MKRVKVLLSFRYPIPTKSNAAQFFNCSTVTMPEADLKDLLRAGVAEITSSRTTASRARTPKYSIMVENKR